MATMRMSEKEAIERGFLIPPPKPPPVLTSAPPTSGVRPFTIVMALIIGWVIGFTMGFLIAG